MLNSFDYKEDFTANGREMLEWFLDYQRHTLLWKIEGLDDEQLQRQHAPSTLTLIGIVKHLTRVERYWLQQDLLGPDRLSLPDSTDPWNLEPGETCAHIVADYRAAIRESDRIVAEHDLDAVLVDPHPDQTGVTLRWALHHMIEETARHLGHADLIREAIDGSRGQNRVHP